MASSAKMRISSKRITTSPPVDEDVLASSSGSWKAVALPEPARMVSLPDPETLEPPKRESKKEIKERERASAKKIAADAVAVETSSPKLAKADIAAPAAKPDVAATPIIGARFAQQAKKKSRTGLYAVIGLGLAAAAGGAFYVVSQNNKSEEKANAGAQVALKDETKQAPRVESAATTTPVAAPQAAVGAGSAAAVEPPPADESVKTGMSADDSTVAGGADRGITEAAPKAAPHKRDNKNHALSNEDKKDTPVEMPKEPKKGGEKADGKEKEGKEGEPSFDQLLKEAGVQDKKVEKPKLEKKSLSGADIKTGMSSVAGKAQGCYAGTQGTAAVKLTVTPDGSVQKVSVTGVFAGTPVGACVESAVKGAKFPAWDGGPQSFGYSYLLAE
ncbi:MAG TPA: hypothetical protein VL326_36085 [Kofleriaceae bacterium]|nr:hypothetical protein [Kofleriaceae bacterium]